MGPPLAGLLLVAFRDSGGGERNKERLDYRCLKGPLWLCDSLITPLIALG